MTNERSKEQIYDYSELDSKEFNRRCLEVWQNIRNKIYKEREESKLNREIIYRHRDPFINN